MGQGNLSSCSRGMFQEGSGTSAPLSPGCRALHSCGVWDQEVPSGCPGWAPVAALVSHRGVQQNWGAFARPVKLLLLRRDLGETRGKREIGVPCLTPAAATASGGGGAPCPVPTERDREGQSRGETSGAEICPWQGWG